MLKKKITHITGTFSLLIYTSIQSILNQRLLFIIFGSEYIEAIHIVSACVCECNSLAQLRAYPTDVATALTLLYILTPCS